MRVTRVTDIDRLSDRAARAAGMKDAAALRRALAPKDRKPGARGSRGGDKVYRIHLAWVGEDPPVDLRDKVPAPKKLDRIGLGSTPRCTPFWPLDPRDPGVDPRPPAGRLQGTRGPAWSGLLPMKADIRKLKALGLTLSHDVGYELSARGAAYLASLPATPFDPSDPV